MLKEHGDLGKVVEEPGSIEDSIAGFKALSMTKPSVIFDSVDVSEIGLKSLLKSETGGALGRREKSASFQTRLNFALREEGVQYLTHHTTESQGHGSSQCEQPGSGSH